MASSSSSSSLASSSQASVIQKPLGFLEPKDKNLIDRNGGKRTEEDIVKERQLKQRVAMEMAQAPAKGLPMQAIMMYMTGSSVSIISIMVVGMCFMNTTKALAAVNHHFKKVDDGHTSLLIPKLIYIAVNLLFLGMGIWKCGKLGLLPTTSADWLSYLVNRQRSETSGIPL